MAPGLTKRHASRSPDGERASKRPVTSSPEEGELDDATPVRQTPIILPASLPAKPTVAPKGKVPFPFKKKAETSRSGSFSVVSEPKDVVAVYERTEEEEKRLRQPDARRKGGRSVATDHWEPNYGRTDSLPSRHHAPRKDYSRDHRDRARSPPASYSPRSRSPASPSSSHNAEKHRLPLPRSPETKFSPPRRDHRDRDRDRNWDRDRNRDWPREPRRHREDENDWHHSKDRQREPAADSNADRYYRPEGSRYSHDYRRGDDREWQRREDMDRRNNRRDDWGHERDYDWPRRFDDYRRSPLPLASRPHSPPPPPTASPPLDDPPEFATGSVPPPPAFSPPPPPPPDARLLKDTRLPTEHAMVSIALKPPVAPRNVHSPTALPLPEPNAEAVDGGQKRKEDKEPEVPKPRPVRKREPVRRSRKEEVEAYGHAFDGCGMQADYSVTTKLGEGTFGEVHKAIQIKTGNIVALKRILMHNEKEGMPVTALREIKILKALKHPCIVELLDMFVVRSSAKDPLSVYMVFPYMDHDLAGLLENDRVKLQPSHIKLYMKQLLEGTEYMHRNNILHRDMKAANLLISNSGSLQIADFGLARAFDGNVARGLNDSRGKERKYTNCVVTRWYRPPELLLGARQYGGEVDLWGIGCVLGEMFTRRPILPGNSDLDQLEKIWHLCGTPNQHTWPNHDALPGCEGVKRFTNIYSRRLRQTYESVGLETCDLLDKLLTCNPRERITAAQALEHDYFWTDPLPADPKTLPSYEASHEFDKRGHRNQHPPPLPPPMPQFDDRNNNQPFRSRPPDNFNRGPPPFRGPNQNRHPKPHFPPQHRNPGPAVVFTGQSLAPNMSYGPRGEPQMNHPNQRGPGPSRDGPWGARPPNLPARPPAPQGFGGQSSSQRGPNPARRGDQPPSRPRNNELNYG